MRPIYHAKADRLDEKVAWLRTDGEARLESWKQEQPESYDWFARSIAHVVMGLGGDSDADTDARIAQHGDISSAELIDALVAVMRQEAFNHRDLQAVDGRLPNGMAVMAMGAHTGCNTVYGSTPSNNPHPYPWMNSLFQDGSTVAWLLGESFIMDHARRSIVPERLADRLLDRPKDVISEADYFEMTHMTDSALTANRIRSTA